MAETTRISATTLARRLGPVPPDRGLPAYRALADRIRAAVLDGRLTVATGLPSERELAAGLKLSRTTVGAAYGLLREQGWLDSRRGSGSRLRLPAGDHQPVPFAVGPPAAAFPRPAATGGAGIFGWQDGVGWQHPADTGDGLPAVIDLTTACLPAPADALSAAVASAATRLPRYLGGDGYLPFGLPVLRDTIAARYWQPAYRPRRSRSWSPQELSTPSR